MFNHSKRQSFAVPFSNERKVLNNVCLVFLIKLGLILFLFAIEQHIEPLDQGFIKKITECVTSDIGSESIDYNHNIYDEQDILVLQSSSNAIAFVTSIINH